jgi:hypothetical protein
LEVYSVIIPHERTIDVNPSTVTTERRRYLEEKYDLEPEELGLLLEDLWAFTEETTEDFVRRRHGELQREGLRNETIYLRLAEETALGRFRCPPLSLRQVRRIVYG